MNEWICYVTGSLFVASFIAYQLFYKLFLKTFFILFTKTFSWRGSKVENNQEINNTKNISISQIIYAYLIISLSIYICVCVCVCVCESKYGS